MVGSYDCVLREVVFGKMESGSSGGVVEVDGVRPPKRGCSDISMWNWQQKKQKVNQNDQKSNNLRHEKIEEKCW